MKTDLRLETTKQTKGKSMSQYVARVLNETLAKNAHEKEFLQAVTEVFGSLESVIEAEP